MNSLSVTVVIVSDMAPAPTEPRWRDIGERIAAVRLMIDKTPARMCEFLGVNAPTYSQWESGDRRPNLDDMLKFCERTQVTLDYIYRGDFSGLAVHIAHQLRDLIDRIRAERAAA